MTRRIFLRTVACLATLGFLRPTALMAGIGELCPGDALTSTFTTIFKKRGSAVIIGREYLRGRRDEADPRVLIDLLCSSSQMKRWSFGSKASREFFPSLGEQVRTDFERGRTVKVRGWVLSETEARLCALAALSSSDC